MKKEQKKYFVEIPEYYGEASYVDQEKALQDTPENRLEFLASSWLGGYIQEMFEEYESLEEILEELDSEVEDFVRGKTDILSGRVYGDHDDPNYCTIKVISYEEQLDNIWRDFHHKREQFFKLFLEEDAS
ncbi:hypothetical protein phi9181_ORF041 [Enterococcus phage 9181]|nr:hypothetical protein phi9181_ORF041 [Enterococcus phage 9181]